MNIINEAKANKVFYEKLDTALEELINRYKDYFDSIKKDRVFILKNLSRDLDRISNLLNNYGFTYSPTDMEDVSEEVFEILVGRYLDGFQEYIDGKGNIETLNTDIKNLSSIVDKHLNVTEHFI